MLLNSELIIVKKNYELIRIIYYLKSCQIFQTRYLIVLSMMVIGICSPITQQLGM